MTKNQNKTKKTAEKPINFINNVKDEEKRKDSLEILEIMKSATGEKPKMWGKIIGFGEYHYKYKSGREGDWFMVGFAPRKQNISLHLTYDVEGNNQKLLEKLGKHKTGKGCLYIKSLDDVDKAVLKKIVKESYKTMQEMDHIQS